jgi:hypothetical protein
MNTVIGPSLACGAPNDALCELDQTPFNVPVQRPHDADPREHRRAAEGLRETFDLFLLHGMNSHATGPAPEQS